MGQSETLAPTSSTNTDSPASSSRRPKPARALRSSPRSPASSDLRSAPSRAPERSAHGGLAYRDSGRIAQEFAMLLEDGRNLLFKGLLQSFFAVWSLFGLRPG